jgi:heptosyltransferase-3
VSAVLDHVPRGARFLIIRLRSLGDCVLTTPAIALLKTARPDLHVGVVAEPRFQAVFTGNPHIAEVLDPAASAVWRFGADLCLNLHGGTRSAVLTAASRARRRAGFAHFRYGWVYNTRIPRAQQILGVERKVHTAEHVASAMFHLGVPMTEIPRAALFADAPAGGRPYAVIHPTASHPDKTWPVARFLEAARHLEAQCGLEPVFLTGPGEDSTPFAAHRRMEAATLEAVKSLLAGAALFVGNDSGPAHMAAAFGVPSVVLFGPSDPVIWGPWKTTAETLIGKGAIAEIETAAVIGALERLRVRA